MTYINELNGDKDKFNGHHDNFATYTQKNILERINCHLNKKIDIEQITSEDAYYIIGSLYDKMRNKEKVMLYKYRNSYLSVEEIYWIEFQYKIKYSNTKGVL